ncbi:MAG TPA: BON domain-containing protein [Longimicrobium sp.]|jgi:hypothetical protein|uniref:BON domain-containing protein n=1 Tax=Longimicrobium sp. TaxID=2029185 RepID=UPI002ED7BC7A
MRGYDPYSFGGGWERQPTPGRRGGYDGFRGQPGGSPQYGRWEQPDRYDRGVYGDSYPGFDPYPTRGGGYGGGMGQPQRAGWAGYGGDYGGGNATRPFLPPSAYQRHPELDREPHRGDRWGYELDDTDVELSDDEILDAVRQRLYEDVWLDVDRIEVTVDDGVVTLTGEVDDFLEARYAWDDAWETEGVRGVITRLVVNVPSNGDTHGDLLPQTTSGTRTEP